MKTALGLFATTLCCAVACQTAAPPDASVARPIDAQVSIPAVVQFTETAWPIVLDPGTGWTQATFATGASPRITSNGTQLATIDVRSRGGDTLVAISYFASGNDITNGNNIVGAEIRVFASSAFSIEMLAYAVDTIRPLGLAEVDLPLKAAHLMSPGEGVTIQIKPTGPGYAVTGVTATWTRPL